MAAKDAGFFVSHIDYYNTHIVVYLWLCDVKSFFYVCANFGENPSRNASVGVQADWHTDRGQLEISRTGFKGRVQVGGLEDEVPRSWQCFVN